MNANIPAGYKLTEVGVIPEDWDVRQLGELCVVNNARINPLLEKYELPCIELEHLKSGTGEIFGFTTTKKTLSQKTTFKTGNVLFGKLRPYLKKYWLAKFDGVCTTEIWVLIPIEKIDSAYLFYLIQSESVLDAANLSIGTKMPRAEWSKVSAILLPLPPLPEQRAIAAALSDVDKLLTKLDELIAKKRDLKQATMQQLLTGKMRLKGFSGDWEVKKLGDLLAYEQPTKYLVSSSEYNDANTVPVLTAGKTFILGYTDENEGVYNDLPVIIFDDFTTASRYVTFQFKVKSSAMKILKPRNPSVNLRIVYEIMQIIDFKLGDHKRYWISEYSKLEINFPSIKEQTAIAEILSDMDAEIAGLEARRDKTRLLKQGMMQELLTGRIRLV